MKIIKKLSIFCFILLTIIFSAQASYCKVIKKEIEVHSKDARILKAQLTYEKNDSIKKYPTVLLLHSIGYSSADWGNLIEKLNQSGYAVIAMDFRGHGQSIYNAKFQKKAWQYFTPKVYQRFPNDVISILGEAQKKSKLVSLNNLAIVGADIGANSAILAAKELKIKPKAMVLISPTTTFKGLYTPVALAEMGVVPILSIVSEQDRYCLEEQLKISKYAQGGFYARNYPTGGMGMMMLKTNPSMSSDIVKWLSKYL